MPVDDSEHLQQQIDELNSIVQILLDRERQMGQMDIPADLEPSDLPYDLENIDNRTAALEAQGDEDWTPKLLPEDAGTSENPVALTPTPEGTETAATDTWDKDDPPTDTDGVTLNITTRLVYDDTSDQVLYGFYRLFTFDNLGSLVTISAETRYTVDTPGACP